MKILLQLFYFLIGSYFTIGLLLFFLQERIIFFPQKLPLDHKFRFNGDFEEKFFQVDDESKIHALHFFSKNPKGVILYFHGNAGSLHDWGHVAGEFVEMGYDVLISDFRGYGKSQGPRSEQAFYQDAEILYDYLSEKYETNQIIIYGRSLGTGVAIDLASKRSAQQLILETPFLSLASVAQKRVPIFPVKLLLKYHFRSDQKISKIEYPIHIFHGTKDGVIPFSEAQRLSEILKSPEVLTIIQNGNHNNLPTFEKYWQKINELLK